MRSTPKRKDTGGKPLSEAEQLKRASAAGYRALALLRAIQKAAADGIKELEASLPPGGPGDPTGGGNDKDN